MYRWDGRRSGIETRAYDRLPRPNTEPNLLDTDTRRKTLLRFFQYNPTARNMKPVPTGFIAFETPDEN
jgi:hypothetical protein